MRAQRVPRLLELESALASTVRELAELREQVAALGRRVENLGVLVDADAGKHSRRIELTPDEWLGPVGEVVERLRPYFDGPERVA